MSDAELLPEFAGFVDNARRGVLAFPRCRSCGRFHWYPMPRCPHCRAPDIEWKPVSGRGRLFSFTVVRHAFDKSRRDRLPYVVGLVAFDDAPGVRFITNIETDGRELRIDEPVEPVFEQSSIGRPIVLFRPAGQAERSTP
jgi:uncharacterized protein